jgi:hypothetical protein
MTCPSLEQGQMDEMEKYAALEHLALLEDNFQQLQQIDSLQQFQEEEQSHRNQERLIQMEQWEQIGLLIQQLNEH